MMDEFAKHADFAIKVSFVITHFKYNTFYVFICILSAAHFTFLNLL